MKKINIIYWIATVLIILFMLSSVVGTFMNNPNGAKVKANGATMNADSVKIQDNAANMNAAAAEKKDSTAEMMDKMGFKPYLLQGLAVAKAVGIIVLLIPGWPRIKEWVYAGFAYDLIGATYGMIAIGMSPKDWFIMPVAIIILAVSYIYFHKRLKLKSAVTADSAV